MPIFGSHLEFVLFCKENNVEIEIYKHKRTTYWSKLKTYQIKIVSEYDQDNKIIIIIELFTVYVYQPIL